MLLAFEVNGATAMFASVGVSVAAVLLFGVGIWPILWLSEFILDYWVYREVIHNPLLLVAVVSLMTTGVVAEGVCAGFLMRKSLQGEHLLEHSSGILRFLLCTLVSCLIGATVGTPLLIYIKVIAWPEAGQTWFTWWTGDILGIMVMAPLIWSWYRHRQMHLTAGKIREVIILLALLVFSLVVIFSPFSIIARAHYPIEYIILPLLIWSAFSFDLRLSSAIVFLVDGVAILATVNGLGPFAAGEVNESLLLLQTFIACVTALTLVLSATRTDNLRFQEALQESEVRYRSVIQSAQSAIVLCKSDGTIVDWNEHAQSIFGYSRDEILGEFVGRILPDGKLVSKTQKGEDAFDDVMIDARAVEGTSSDTSGGGVLEWCGVSRDGKQFPIEVSLSTWKMGQETYYSGMIQDISERKASQLTLQEAKDEAERANQAKSEFLSRMSHELRTPLNAILGFGQLLEMRDLGQRENQQVRLILTAGHHLLALINDVLEITRIERGDSEVVTQAISLENSVREVLDLIHPLAVEKGITIIKEAPHPAENLDGIYVLADAQRLRQVLLNLLSNAVKYNREAGQIFISYDLLNPGEIRLNVRDTGLGISEQNLNKLFVAFERLDAEKLGVEGTGLGLLLSRRFMDEMGGLLNVESVVGQGSTFYLQLPRALPLAQSIDADSILEPLKVLAT